MSILMNELTDRIETWFEQRNLHTADPRMQLLKLGEEFGELCQGFTKKRPEEMQDAVGDMYVVLVGFCKQNGFSMESCVHGAYNEIKDRKGKLINGIFIKEEDLPC